MAIDLPNNPIEIGTTVRNKETNFIGKVKEIKEVSALVINGVVISPKQEFALVKYTPEEIKWENIKQIVAHAWL